VNLLFAARQSNKPYGVIVLSERLNASWHNFTGFKDGPDFIRRIPTGWPAQANFMILASKHATTPDGFAVDEMDYTASGEYDSGIAIRLGDYIVVFKCRTASFQDLKLMNKISPRDESYWIAGFTIYAVSSHGWDVKRHLA
jgi:hypothetical protein